MPDMTHDLIAAREAVRTGKKTARELLEAAIHQADSDAAKQCFVRRFDAQALTCADAVDAARAAGGSVPALAGLSVSIKDLFDVAGQPTTAGSRVLHGAAVAEQDAPTVARLRAAGAALIGHTNMTEFAYSGVGINPHWGTPSNAATLTLDKTPRIPGGSTSGGAVSVAAGAAWAALGSDTGGSIRIPAAFHGLVGFKNTQRLTPLQGSVPLSPTLDTTCAITRSVRDAILLHEVLSARQVVLPHLPVKGMRLGVPITVMLDDLEPAVARSFERALTQLRAAGAHIEEFALAPIAELAGLQSSGGFAAPESWAWHRTLLANHSHEYDPRVLSRILRGEATVAADYLDLHAARRAWISAVGPCIQRFDALLSPTLPLVAPPIAALLTDDAAFYATNARILRNPSVVNFLDGCALSMPCHSPGEFPVGMMVWGAAMQDDTVLDVSLAIEAVLNAAHFKSEG